jgi:hypothetical protein
MADGSATCEPVRSSNKELVSVAILIAELTVGRITAGSMSESCRHEIFLCKASTLVLAQLQRSSQVLR